MSYGHGQGQWYIRGHYGDLTGRTIVLNMIGVLLVVLALVTGCAGQVDLVRTSPAEGDLVRLVDSEAARRLLADLLARRSLDPALSALAPGILQADLVQGPEPAPLPDQARLRELAQQVSVDFAALAFARAVGADARSRAVQTTFDRFVKDGALRSGELLREPKAFPYTVLFVPSWLYVSHPETGADFAHGRRALDRLGISNGLISAIGESDSVEDNAAVIAAAVRAAGREGPPILLVSASKSGAEAALALSRKLDPDETTRIAAWVNIVGALNGSPLADAALRPPASWFARAVCWVNGWNFDGVASLATGPSRDRLAGARLPGSIAVVNVIAVTLSGTVGHKVFPGYQVLLKQGPNDGVVLLADTVWPGGANIVALGADHLFAPREEDTQILAIMRAVDFAVRLHGSGPESRSDLRDVTPAGLGSTGSSDGVAVGARSTAPRPPSERAR